MRIRKAVYIAAHVALIPANIAFHFPAHYSREIRNLLWDISDRYDSFCMKVFKKIDPDGSINEELMKRGW